jgi:hypothetical protein
MTVRLNLLALLHHAVDQDPPGSLDAVRYFPLVILDFSALPRPFVATQLCGSESGQFRLTDTKIVYNPLVFMTWLAGIFWF